MKRALIVVVALLSLSVSAALAAPPANSGKPASPGQSANAPGQSSEQNAAKWCKAERTRLGVQGFKDAYGTNANKANAFGKCVSKRVKQSQSS